MTEQSPELSSGEVRRRAVSGAVIDGLRGIGVRALGLLGMVVLARLLTPKDFGAIAFGAALISFIGFLSDGGVGTALIRREEAPSRADYRAIVGFQLVVNTLLAVVIAAATAPFGTVGQVTALMAFSLPVAAFRAPGFIIFERRVEYRPLALVEMTETGAYYVYAIATVAAGWGVWGFASASIVRTVVGTGLLLFLNPAGRMLPSLSWSRVRALLGFGFRYQATGFVHMLREQGINVAVAAVGGAAALGLWSVAFRILQVPLLFFNSLWRVSYPAMSRLVAAREDLRETLERVVAVVAVGAGMLLAPLVASSSDAVPLLLGERWSEAADVIPPACLNLMLSAPLSVALVGYLWAVGDASVPLRSALFGIPVMAAVMLPLLPVVGVVAVGYGWLAAGFVETAALVIGARKHVRISIASRLAPPVAFAVLAALAGALVARAIESHLLGAVAGALLAVVVYLAGLWLAHRRHLDDAIELASRGVRGAISRSAAA